MRTNFAGQIRGFTKRTLKKTTKLVVLMGVDAYIEVYKLSPVDTGQFRASWRAANQNADKSTAPRVIKAGSRSPGSTIARQAAPKRNLVTKVRNILKARSLGDAAIISNNVDYAHALNTGGKSPQAKQPFVPMVEQIISSRYADYVRKL